jgi:hypothetical protein
MPRHLAAHFFVARCGAVPFNNMIYMGIFRLPAGQVNLDRAGARV